MSDDPLLDKLINAVAQCTQGFGQFDVRYSTPQDNQENMYFLYLAPALMEINMPSEDDGEEVYEGSMDVNLLALQSVLDVVNDMSLAFDEDIGGHAVFLDGELDGEAVEMVLFLAPFEDAEVMLVIERKFTEDGQPTITFRPKDAFDEDGEAEPGED